MWALACFGGKSTQRPTVKIVLVSPAPRVTSRHRLDNFAGIAILPLFALLWAVTARKAFLGESETKGLPQSASPPMRNCLDFGWRNRHLQKAVCWRGPCGDGKARLARTAGGPKRVAAANNDLARGTPSLSYA